MRNPQTIILNGKEYDALTGKPINRVTEQVIGSIPKIKDEIVDKLGLQKPRSVDGFVNQQRSSIAPTHSAKKTSKTHRVAPNSKRELSRSQTLMRHTLKKPVISLKNPLIQPMKHSKYVSKVSDVLRSSDKLDKLSSKVLEIKDKTSGVLNNINTEPPIISKDIHTKNIEKLSTVDDSIYQTAATEIKDSQNVKPTKTRKVKLFHLNPITLYVISACLIVLIVGLIFGYIYKNSISLYIADFETGISAKEPSYIPPGYKLQKLYHYKNGNIGIVNFRYVSNKSDNNNYLTISESSSSLDNNGLLASQVVPSSGDKYKTIMINGLVVYYYNNSYVWLNAGILYYINNTANINEVTIIDIIGSI
ncbi:MAG TPA: DUF4367 domain-containing protein [Candidatus Saccharimonadia bacterium]|nr:DUF4367 domain-containing protein [Candidatus Saccharimonadia bacterium]